MPFQDGDLSTYEAMAKKNKNCIREKSQEFQGFTEFMRSVVKKTI